MTRAQFLILAGLIYSTSYTPEKSFMAFRTVVGLGLLLTGLIVGVME